MNHRILRAIPLALLAFSLPALTTAASADPVSIKVNLTDKGGKDAHHHEHAQDEGGYG